MSGMNTDTENHQEDASFIPPDLAIQAMRDNGYKNTAYALAELIDNSVQANAKAIEIICIEEVQQIRERQRKRLSSIAVLDDGDGMNGLVLRKALQFGNGTRLNDRSGIGRFGRGSPMHPSLKPREWTSGPGKTARITHYIHSSMSMRFVSANSGMCHSRSLSRYPRNGVNGQKGLAAAERSSSGRSSAQTA